VSRFIEVITSSDSSIRNLSLDDLCRNLSAVELFAECEQLERFRHTNSSLYERVRALFFLYAIHRFHLPLKPEVRRRGMIPYNGYCSMLERRFEEAIGAFVLAQASDGPSTAISSALAAGYRALGFQTLADQVRQSVRAVRGNQWMFRTGSPDEHPLRVRSELLQDGPLFPILREATPVRMDLSHSGWSDIFFLGMDYPEGARVLNISIDLSVRGAADSGRPCPPVESFFRVIDEPVLRLTSIDLKCSADVTSIAEIFDFARDYLGLLKAGVIASGLVPPAMEGAEPLSELLANLTGRAGHGIELVTRVNDIPKGSRLAVSTNLLASIITVCMRATRQIHALTGTLEESDRRLVAARAILGEWLGGSGGGWQDSGGIWPGVKLIEGVKAREGDPEYGISRGCLLPKHRVLSSDEVSPETCERLQQSLVLVHGGMAQDVGPILEIVTEKYLLRSEREWEGRQQARTILDEMLKHLHSGDIQSIGADTQANFDGPVQQIIPWAANLYTGTLIQRVRDKFKGDFWGFWMLGGMSGGGMGFLFSPKRKAEAQIELQLIMSDTKRRMQYAVPFAMEPVVYDFAINQRGTEAILLQGEEALMPPGYYLLVAPRLIRTEVRLLSSLRRTELEHFAAACKGHTEFADLMPQLFERMLPQNGKESSKKEASLELCLKAYGFDAEEHKQIQVQLISGRIGLARNRLPESTRITDVASGDVFEIESADTAIRDSYRAIGIEALKQGQVAVVSLAGGIGSRWTKGAGVVKAINPFCRLGGEHRSFIEVHLAKSMQVGGMCGILPPHVFTTSYMTHDAIREHLETVQNYGYPGSVLLSQGRTVGLRMVPMERDLRFAWEETQQQVLDKQAQKVRESLRESLVQWARHAGEGSNYTDNLPAQCMHPVGHWYEVPNMLRNGTLAQLLELRPQLKHLLLHNIDTVGVNLDPTLLGYHIEQGAAMTTEVISRHIEDRGGGLARVQGRLRLVEGLALPSEEIESRLSYYNSATYWIDIDQLLDIFNLTRFDVNNADKVNRAVRELALRMPAYITLKDVKKRWGKGQEDIFPVTQFEKLWGDMTVLPEFTCSYVAVPRLRGQQLKEPAQLDGWLRDGSAAYVESLCDWGGRCCSEVAVN
jgi:hypothetical protein